MTIVFELHDSHGNNLQLNDVVMIEYTNPLLKYVGVLKYDEEMHRLVISDLDDGYQPFPKNDWESIKLLQSDIDVSKLDRYFGRSEFLSRKQMDDFIKKLYKQINFIEKGY